MKTRSALAHWLLALLLLLSQQLATVHGLSHLSDARNRTTQEKQLPADQACAQCVAFAQVGTGLTGKPFVLADLGVDEAAGPVAARTGPAAVAFTAFRSRAPPAAA